MPATGRMPRSAAGPAAAFALAFGLGASPAWAAQDRKPPTTPTDLRVTGVTAYSVSLAWNPSTDNSGIFSYVICCANVSSETVGQQATTHVYRAGLEANRSFTLRSYARDAAGNYSKASNSVTFRTLADTQPPTRPAVSVTDVGPTHVSLAWSSIEDGPHTWFTVFRNGSPVLQGSRSTSSIFPLLEPETPHTFSVVARDFGGNVSPMSDPVSATTDPSNPEDTSPPTTPQNLREDNWGDCEVQLTWSESTDDLDPQWIIEYEVFVNDVFDHSTSLRFTRTIVYGTMNGPNTFAVVAVDTAGNRSEAATVDANLNCVP